MKFNNSLLSIPEDTEIEIASIEEKEPEIIYPEQEEFTPSIMIDTQILSAYELDLFEERSAIMEFDGHIHKPRAEENAYKEILNQRNNKNDQISNFIVNELGGLEILNEKELSTIKELVENNGIKKLSERFSS